jgi:long-chain acyl-CoA synthetase
MLHPSYYAEGQPDHPAIIMGGGTIISYGELTTTANRISHLFREHGLRTGDHIAILMENRAEFLQICWAAQSSGLYFTPINSHLRTAEVQYILEDCGAKALVSSDNIAVATELDVSGLVLCLMAGTPAAGYESLEQALAEQPSSSIGDPAEGAEMLYSGGTTGRPKGVLKPSSGGPLGDPQSLAVQAAQGIGMYGIDTDTVYMSPAPLYHAAPIVYSMAVHRLGGTVVIMEKFDPQQALDLIERHRVTMAQFVPTMFTRMLRLPDDVREAADVSSLRMAIHSAAPCPIEVKKQMIDWWGPILLEYYSGTEGVGFAVIGSQDWLAHPGSVGRPMSPVHIVDDDDNELPTGVSGTIYFEGDGRKFEYHNDEEKTASVTNEHGWMTLGDMGYLDEDGFLYLTDRKAHMIVSGGVNIYPQETEDVLVMHPAVADAAVVGVPDADMGEQVKAVIELIDDERASDDLAAALIAHCREKLASYKCPASIDFVDALPRDPSGKLYKRLLRDQYWSDHETKIV